MKTLTAISATTTKITRDEIRTVCNNKGVAIGTPWISAEGTLAEIKVPYGCEKTAKQIMEALFLAGFQYKVGETWGVMTISATR